MKYAEEITQYCLENRVSTTEVADALNKSGVLPDVLPISPNHYRVGRVRTIFTAYNSNYAVHEQIREVKKNDVVIIFSHECKKQAIVGELICKYLLFYKGASAVVVNGFVRDAASIKRERYAVWAEGVTPLGCLNTPAEDFPVEAAKELRKSYEGGVAVCDDGGVTIVPESMLDKDMLERLHLIEMQEDIWFYCLDTLKWDTKKIVCDKAYFTEQKKYFSSIQIDKLKRMLHIKNDI